MKKYEVGDFVTLPAYDGDPITVEVASLHPTYCKTACADCGKTRKVRLVRRDIRRRCRTCAHILKVGDDTTRACNGCGIRKNLDEFAARFHKGRWEYRRTCVLCDSEKQTNPDATGAARFLVGAEQALAGIEYRNITVAEYRREEALGVRTVRLGPREMARAG